MIDSQSKIDHAVCYTNGCDNSTDGGTWVSLPDVSDGSPKKYCDPCFRYIVYVLEGKLSDDSAYSPLSAIS